MPHRPTILICDDEVHVRHVVGLKLQEAGYRVITASDGEEGLRIARQEQPDLIVTDYLMPKMDGIALCEKLRSDSQTQVIDLILLTARGANLPQSALDSINPVAVFNKPFSPRELIDQINKQVAGNLQTRERGAE